jgi:hypothetical protein
MDHVGSVDTLLAELNTNDSPIEFAAIARSLPLLQHPPNKNLESGEPARKLKALSPVSSHAQAASSLRASYTALSVASQPQATSQATFTFSTSATAPSSPAMPSSLWAGLPSAASLRGSFPFPTSPRGVNRPRSSAQRSCSLSVSDASPAATASYDLAASQPFVLLSARRLLKTCPAGRASRTEGGRSNAPLSCRGRIPKTHIVETRVNPADSRGIVVRLNPLYWIQRSKNLNQPLIPRKRLRSSFVMKNVPITHLQ